MIDPVRVDRSAGFMLVEVVVALAIVALAFGMAFRSLSGALDRLGKDHSAAEALLFAQSTLDRIGHDIALDVREIRGNTKDGFSWAVETAPYQSGAAPTPGPLAGYVVQVTVAWQQRNNAQRVRLTTMRLARREPAS